MNECFALAREEGAVDQDTGTQSSYRPGPWTAVAAETLVALLGPSIPEAVVEQLSRLSMGQPSFDDALALLTNSRGAVAPFALVVPDNGHVTHTAVCGDVVLHAKVKDGRTVQVEGRGVATWVDLEDASSMVIQVRSAQDAPTRPLGPGLVAAGSLHLLLRRRGAHRRVGGDPTPTSSLPRVPVEAPRPAVETLPPVAASALPESDLLAPSSDEVSMARVGEVLARADEVSSRIDQMRATPTENHPLTAGEAWLPHDVSEVDVAELDETTEFDETTELDETTVETDRILAARVDQALTARADEILTEMIDEALAERTDRVVATEIDRVLAQKTERLLTARVDEVLTEKANQVIAAIVDQVLVEKIDQTLEARIDQALAETADQVLASRADQVLASRADQVLASRADQVLASRADQVLAARAEVVYGDAVYGRVDEVVVEARGLTKIYCSGNQRIAALDSVDLDLVGGTLTVITGPPGAGKSTILNLLGGVDRPTSGTIVTAGTAIHHLDDQQLTSFRRDMVGFVFEHHNLAPTLTVAENITTGVPRHSTSLMRPDNALSLVGLGGRGALFPPELSDGQRQRAAIARALTKRPVLLLCDEPTSTLDTRAGEEVIQALADVADATGIAAVVVTHNQAFEPFADQVVRLRDGRVVNA